MVKCQYNRALSYALTFTLLLDLRLFSAANPITWLSIESLIELDSLPLSLWATAFCIYSKKIVSLHSELGYGVTVALQILVLSVQVRILISQPEQ